MLLYIANENILTLSSNDRNSNSIFRKIETFRSNNRSLFESKDYNAAFLSMAVYLSSASMDIQIYIVIAAIAGLYYYYKQRGTIAVNKQERAQELNKRYTAVLQALKTQQQYTNLVQNHCVICQEPTSTDTPLNKAINLQPIMSDGKCTHKYHKTCVNSSTCLLYTSPSPRDS